MLIALKLLLVVFFLFMNAFFVTAEFALVKVRKSQVELMLAEGKRAAVYVKKVTDNLNAYLSACQLGITLASLALGWLGEPAVSQLFEPLFTAMHLPAYTVSAVSVIIGFAIITTLHIVFGELVPKSLAIFSTEKYALMTSTILFWFYRLTAPIMWLFNSTTNGLLHLVGHSLDEESVPVSSDELMMMMGDSYRQGIIQEDQYNFVDNIFDLPDKNAAKIMTPRPDMICLYLQDDLATHMETVNQSKFTRYPVCDDDKDHVVGFVHIKDIYPILDGSDSFDSIIRKIPAVPETLTLGRILTLFRNNNSKMAIVIDEHGGTSGLVTLSDVLEEIVGEMRDEYFHDESRELLRLKDGNFLIEGTADIDKCAEELDLAISEDCEAETMGGFLLDLFDKIPQVGESCDFDNYTFKVKEMDGLRIKLIEVKKHK